MNDQSSGNVYKENYQYYLFVFNFKQMHLEPSFKGLFGVSNILLSSASFTASENILWFSV